MKISGLVLPEWALWLAGGAAVYWWMRGPAKAGQDLGQAVAGVADGVFSGAVKTVGGVFGVPDTDVEKCQSAQLSGDTAGVYAYCPAIEALAWDTEQGWARTKAILSGTKTPAVKSRTLTPAEKNWEYVPLEEATSGCIFGDCSPSFESQSKDSSVFFWDASSDILRPQTVTPVNGIRG